MITDKNKFVQCFVLLNHILMYIQIGLNFGEGLSSN